MPTIKPSVPPPHVRLHELARNCERCSSLAAATLAHALSYVPPRERSSMLTQPHNLSNPAATKRPPLILSIPPLQSHPHASHRSDSMPLVPDTCMNARTLSGPKAPHKHGGESPPCNQFRKKEWGWHILDDLELVELVGAGRRLTLVFGVARLLQGLGAVEGCAGPDLGGLLRPQASSDGLGGLLGLIRRRSPLSTRQHKQTIRHTHTSAHVPTSSPTTTLLYPAPATAGAVCVTADAMRRSVHAGGPAAVPPPAALMRAG